MIAAVRGANHARSELAVTQKLQRSEFCFPFGLVPVEAQLTS